MRKENGKIWLSHSGVDVLYRCPRCFWLKYNRKLYQPEGIVSRLPDRFDRIIKNYFSLFRATGDLPPLIAGKVPGKLENPFQEIYFCNLNDKYGFYGKLDDCLATPENQFIPIDFKTASSDPNGKTIFPAYQNQMDEYCFLLEANQKKTVGIGYLIFFYPQQSEALHNGFPMAVHVETVQAHPETVESRLSQAIEILENKMPLPAAECSFCRWYEELEKILKQ